MEHLFRAHVEVGDMSPRETQIVLQILGRLGDGQLHCGPKICSEKWL